MEDEDSVPVPENVYGTPDTAFVPDKLAKVVPAPENYVAHGRFLNKGNHVFLVITDSKIYKRERTSTPNQSITRSHATTPHHHHSDRQPCKEEMGP
jgi:hypothetical protein